MGVLYVGTGAVRIINRLWEFEEVVRPMTRPRVWTSALMGIFLATSWWIATGPSQTSAQSSKTAEKLSGPQTKNPGAWPYADGYDEVVAADEVYHVRYEDQHI